MKKIIILLFFVVVSNVKGQIGMYTTNPKALLHVDSNKDNDQGGLYTDDVVITDQGNIGIGIESLAPEAKLEVKGTFKYVDGNQADKFILISDEDGNAHWKKEPKPFYTLGEKNEFKNITGDYQFIGPNITLNAGNWLVSCVVTYSMANAPGIVSNIYWDLSTSDTSLSSIGQVISNPSQGISSTVYGYSTVHAVYLITSTTKQTYYLWAKATNLTNGTQIEYSDEAQIWAMSIEDE